VAAGLRVVGEDVEYVVGFGAVPGDGDGGKDGDGVFSDALDGLYRVVSDELDEAVWDWALCDA
jgi:hypothetical protein